MEIELMSNDELQFIFRALRFELAVRQHCAPPTCDHYIFDPSRGGWLGCDRLEGHSGRHHYPPNDADEWAEGMRLVAAESRRRLDEMAR